MTTYGAYDRGLPCRNPSCKSHGKPHPNCRCYGNLAEGGDVSFCASDRAHDQGCEYFQDGGPVGDFDSLPEDAAPAPEAAAPSFDDLKPDAEAAPPAFDDLKEDDQSSDGLGSDNEDLSPADLQKKMIDAAHPNGVSKYETPSQQLAGIAEGIARGVMPIGTNAVETGLLGIPEEDIIGRRDANPVQSGLAEAAGTIGGLATGVGELGMASKMAAHVADYARLGKVGSGILKGALANGLIQADDEASKMILGDNPDHPVAASLIATGLGGLLGGIGGKAASMVSDKLSKLSDTKLGDKASSWLAGLGSAASPGNEAIVQKTLDAIDKGAFSQEAFDAGAKSFGSMMGNAEKSLKPLSIAGAAGIGYHENGVQGALEGAAVSLGAGLGGKIALKGLQKMTNRVGAPIVMKILSSGNTQGILEALNHAETVQKGLSAIDSGVEGLFTGSGKFGAKTTGKLESNRNRQRLEEWIDGGGVDQDLQMEIRNQQAPASQNFAEGGDVKPIHQGESGLAAHFPEQNVVMHTAKARASNYLNSLRPAKHQAKLAFDEEPDDREQKRTYKKALDVAASPISILKDIQDGTIEPDHIKHLNAMFPEVTSLLQKKATERILKAQVDGKKPNYKVRQGLSMLLGTPLSGELTPQSISAAQAVFAAKKPGQGPQGGGAPSAKGSQPLSKSDRSYLTDDQARQQRQQRQT